MHFKIICFFPCGFSDDKQSHLLHWKILKTKDEESHLESQHSLANCASILAVSPVFKTFSIFVCSLDKIYMQLCTLIFLPLNEDLSRH